MVGRLLLLLVVVSLAGCTRYQSRQAKGQARMPSPYAPRSEVTPRTDGMATRSPLSMPPTSAPAKPGTPTEPEPSLVPPLPREPVPPGYVVPPPKRPEDREASQDVVPAAGSLPAVSTPRENTLALQPGKLEKDNRPEPSPKDLPSPFAKGVEPAAASVANSNNFDKVQSLAANALERWNRVDTYEARMTRRETVNGKVMPEEEMLYRVRRGPFAISMKNTGPTGRGREVIYNPSQHGDKLHVITGAGDSFIGAGFRAPPMSPDDKRVMEKSRHSIREAGFGNSIRRFQDLIEKVKTGRAKPDTLTFAGAEARKDMPGFTLERVDQTIVVGEDPQTPRGGKRMWYFDAKPGSLSYGMPVLVVTFEGNREVEYYRFDNFRIPAGLTDQDFDPANLGKKK